MAYACGVSPRADRRTPNFLRFIGIGALVGFVVGFLVAMFGDPVPDYSMGTQVAYLGAMGAGLGGLIAAIIAVFLSPRD